MNDYPLLKEEHENGNIKHAMNPCPAEHHDPENPCCLDCCTTCKEHCT